MREKKYDVIVCGAGTAGVVAAMPPREGISPDAVNTKQPRKILIANGAIV